MYTLEPTLYHKVRPLFEPVSHHLATVAILERSAPAAIYVDDPTQGLLSEPEELAFREATIHVMGEIDAVIEEDDGWPIE